MPSILPRFRPFTTWNAPTTALRRVAPSPVEYIRLIDDILRELVHLGAYDIVISTAHDPREIRLDGWPRVGAKKPWHPGVSVYFNSNQGRLAFSSDTYEQWQANLRAIGLTLEKLRALDRDGATGARAQYKRYAALPPAEPEHVADPAREGTSPPPDAPIPAANPREAAANLLLATGGFEVSPKNVRLLLGSSAHNANERERVWRAAVKAAHPDRNAGEGHETFLAVQAAYELLGAA